MQTLQSIHESKPSALLLEPHELSVYVRRVDLDPNVSYEAADGAYKKSTHPIAAPTAVPVPTFIQAKSPTK